MTEAAKQGSTDKYDRQLRLWGANGQRALMDANILLVNAGPTGTETLKNLVLPAVGRFTVLDNKIVQQADCAHNFFVTSDHIGKPRAETVTELLVEMNADCSGTSRVADPAAVIASEPDFFKNFTLIIATQMPLSQLLPLSKICQEAKIPLLVARSYGLIGYVRLCLPEHNVVESKPDNFTDDLRIANPFPELLEFVSTFDLDQLSAQEHGHVPYVVILSKATHAWRESHDGKLPKTFAEKEEFKKTVQAFSAKAKLAEMGKILNLEAMTADTSCKAAQELFTRKVEAWKDSVAEDGSIMSGARADKVPEAAFGSDQEKQAFARYLVSTAHEENFVEADASAYTAYVIRDVPWEVQAIIDDDKASDLTPDSKSFWFLVRALRDFMALEGEGCLPLSGVLPDMTAATKPYMTMQQVYHKKALADKTHIQQRLTKLLADQGITDTAAAAAFVSNEELSTFCKNAYNLQLLRTRSLEEETTKGSTNFDELSMEFMDGGEDTKQHPGVWYFALRAADAFFAKHGRLPGDTDVTIEADTAAVKQEAVDLLKALELDLVLPAFTDDHAAEITRYGGAEIHTIAAFVGGVASQEAVKIITHQFVPLNNTFVYNGITSSAAQFEL